jgi:hypothetical protein
MFSALQTTAPFPRSHRIESAPLPVYVKVSEVPTHIELEGVTEKVEEGADPFPIVIAFVYVEAVEQPLLAVVVKVIP